MAQNDEPERAPETIHAVVERLAREAERLKKLSELQALKQNPKEISVDTQDLLSLIAEEAQKQTPPDAKTPEPPPG